MSWRNKPATQKQLQYLEKMSNWVDGVNVHQTTAGEASDEIDRHKVEMRLNIRDELAGAYADLCY